MAFSASWSTESLERLPLLRLDDDGTALLLLLLPDGLGPQTSIMENKLEAFGGGQSLLHPLGSFAATSDTKWHEHVETRPGRSQTGATTALSRSHQNLPSSSRVRKCFFGCSLMHAACRRGGLSPS